ncbi:excinuclease ABC subunit A, partial [Candidatus Epulonipiscium fishelsonii]
KCGKEIKKQTIDQIVDQLLLLEGGTRVQLLAPIVRGRKGSHEKILKSVLAQGYIRAIIDGNMHELSEEEDLMLDKKKKHTIEIIVDRVSIRKGIEKRLTDSIETVMKLTGGLLTVDIFGKEGIIDTLQFSENFSCPDCNISIEEIEPRLFSFNNPYGACSTCMGLGQKLEIDKELVVPNTKLTLRQGAIAATGWGSIANQGSYVNALMEQLMQKFNFDLDTPFEDLDEDVQHMLFYGTPEHIQFVYQGEYSTRKYDYAFEGILENIKRRYNETSSEGMKAEYEAFFTSVPCDACGGARLKPEALAVTVADKNISQITNQSIGDLKTFFQNVTLDNRQKIIGDQVLKEINARLGFLVDVGLDYLSLSRSSGTLSGGETQRIRLATQIGSGLVGVLYILDEPSIGLHQRDNERLIATLIRLRNLGNTLIVVEHDEDTMYAADWIVDIGPSAGEHGGKIIVSGTLQDILDCKESETGAYLSGRKKIEVPKQRRAGNGHKLIVKGAKENNLKNVNVSIPLGTFICVTGVSGSGKSTLINEILLKRLARDLNHAKVKAGKHKDIIGIENLDKVISIDQSPIGRTPRSNPATYVGVFDYIRDVFTKTPDAKLRGYQKGRFSFNVKGGRCEACSGDGVNKIEMHFLPDVYIECEVCHGKRYNRETLDVKYKGKSIADILAMTVEEALKFFENIPSINRKLQTLYDVGLSYIKLGQPSTTLSGGEAQRVKLADELSKRSTGKTMYILDEPTTGLHFADVHKLIGILERLVDNGNTVVVIEHNLDVIKTADYIIDLGPEGGTRGGEIVATGTPEEVSKIEYSYTGKFLKKMLS